MSNVKNLAVSYMWHKAVADKEKARLSLELLTNQAAGIGDHSTEDYYKNLDEALDGLVDAKARLETLSEEYPEVAEAR